MRIAVLLSLALGACGTGSAPTSSVDVRPIAPPASASGSPTAAAPSFTCGPRPACPANHPTDERAILDEVWAENAAGRVDRAAALVACLGDKVRIDADPGFSDLEPSKDSKYLLAHVDHDDVVRVFDAKTWTETMRLDDALTATSALGSRVVVNHRAGNATLWDLATRMAEPTPIPTVASVSAEGTAVFWLESSPRRTLAIAIPSKEIARIPIDAAPNPKSPLTLAELPGGQYLASVSTSTSGQQWIVDPATSTVVRSFHVADGRPVRLAQNAVLVDVGSYVSGFDFLFFEPSRAPIVLPLATRAPAQALTGRGCATSVVVAVSDDGVHAVTRSKDAWCLFDVPTRKLLGTVKDASQPNVDVGLTVRGTFVGPNVVVGSIGSSTVRLRVMTGRPDPLYDLAPVGPGGTLLTTTSSGSLFHSIDSLAAHPVEHAWVGTDQHAHGQPTRLLYEVRTDGSIVSASLPVDWQSTGRALPQLDPKGEHVVSVKGLDVVRSCLLHPVGACVDVPIGGSYEIALDGTWIAGPAIVGPLEWTSPAFVGRNGALAVASVATGKPLLVHHAPGFRAAAFTSETELGLFGEDGALLGCSLDTRRCRRAATNPSAGVIRTERGQLVIGDDATVASVPALKSVLRAADVKPAKPMLRVPDQEKFLHVGRSIIVQEHNALVLKNAQTGDVVRTIPIATRAFFAASTAPPRLAVLGARELAVYDLDTGAKLFARKVSDTAFAPTGAVAIDAAGKQVAFAFEKDLRVIDVDTGQERAHWPIPESYYATIGISPDGTKVATQIDVVKTPKGHKAEYTDPADQLLLVMDPSAPAKVERIPLGPLRARTDRGQSGISLTNSGYVVLTYAEGGARLVDPSRKVFDLSREASDDGIWLRSDAGVASLGTLAPSSRGLGCHLGAQMLPTAACLPVLCERAN